MLTAARPRLRMRTTSSVVPWGIFLGGTPAAPQGRPISGRADWVSPGVPYLARTSISTVTRWFEWTQVQTPHQSAKMPVTAPTMAMPKVIQSSVVGAAAASARITIASSMSQREAPEWRARKEAARSGISGRLTARSSVVVMICSFGKVCPFAGCVNVPRD